MNDFVGQRLTLGDKVVHGRSGRYGGLHGPFYIIAFTPKMIRLSRSFDGAFSMNANPENLVRVPS